MTQQQGGGERDERLAPVVSLFGGTVPPVPPAPSPSDADWHATWKNLLADDPIDPVAPALEDDVVAERDEETAHAEKRLMRALASRGLSEREARERLRRDGLSNDAVEDVIDRLVRVGAIDDAVLAEQLVYAGVTRKHEGRRAIGQALNKRGIARDVIDAALAELPDDDFERALEYARTKARSLSRYDRDTGLRRLVGQLARRGYGGSMAMTVANQALDEAQGGSSGVRFR
ncbi:regulatory protein RecX [Microbacterium amylolyticum]|uniref:Regulatory protein RecX n=1 Tax=Microbacterium amylolyticum TaxID=936337 RepID=A0ABS4ZFU9_9MICO|nr:regulatory protein RecX [Microbacterium amylolyticum]MBP2436149.1 regulatory protein [Microbacterium amylolyticum]